MNEAGQRLIELCQENALVIAKPSSNNTREDSTHGRHQIVNTKIRLIIFFAAKDGEALYNGIPSPLLALFVVMLPKAHLTLHSSPL